jgi:hypothetical protein
MALYLQGSDRTAVFIKYNDVKHSHHYHFVPLSSLYYLNEAEKNPGRLLIANNTATHYQSDGNVYYVTSALPSWRFCFGPVNDPFDTLECS